MAVSMISVVMVGGTPENDLVVNTMFGLAPDGQQLVGVLSVRRTGCPVLSL